MRDRYGPSPHPSSRPSTLSHLERPEDRRVLVAQMFQMIGHSRLFDDFRVDDVEQLAGFMQFYRAHRSAVIICEGEVGDYMLRIS